MLQKLPSAIPSATKKSLQNSMNLTSLQRYVHIKFTKTEGRLHLHYQIRVLQQLTQWTMGNPDRIRERMEEQKDSEQTFWVTALRQAHNI